jgi:hypothetical protein
MKTETLAITHLGTVFVKYSNTGLETWIHTKRPTYKKEGLATIITRKKYTYHGITIEFKYKNGTYIWH